MDAVHHVDDRVKHHKSGKGGTVRYIYGREFPVKKSKIGKMIVEMDADDGGELRTTWMSAWIREDPGWTLVALHDETAALAVNP